MAETGTALLERAPQQVISHALALAVGEVASQTAAVLMGSMPPARLEAAAFNSAMAGLPSMTPAEATPVLAYTGHEQP